MDREAGTDEGTLKRRPTKAPREVTSLWAYGTDGYTDHETVDG